MMCSVEGGLANGVEYCRRLDKWCVMLQETWQSCAMLLESGQLVCNVVGDLTTGVKCCRRLYKKACTVAGDLTTGVKCCRRLDN